MKLSRQQAQDILYGETEDYEIIEDSIDDHSRWSVGHRLIVKHLPTGKFFRTYYSKGATEYQDEGPFEYEEEVEFTEVVPTEVTVIVYKEIVKND